MNIHAIKTHKITREDTDIRELLDRYLPSSIGEKSVVVVTSKIVSICEGRVIPIDQKLKVEEVKKEKDLLVEKEAELFIPSSENPYGFSITVTNGIMVASAGIDESNGNGYFVLWPEDVQKSVNTIREYLVEKYKVKEIGVIITDSKTTPLRWGVTGVAIAHSGFMALNSYIGKPDIFGRLMRVEKLNVADCLATAAVVTMGEGNEQTPLALIEEVPFVVFQQRNPTEEELATLQISLEEDIYSPMLKKIDWKKSRK